MDQQETLEALLKGLEELKEGKLLTEEEADQLIEQ